MTSPLLSAAITLKGASFTFTVLQIKSSDLGAIEAQLLQKIQQAPLFFDKAPLVLDLSMYPAKQQTPPPFSALASLLHKHKLCPIGVRYAQAAWRAEAEKAGFVLLPEGTSFNPKEQDFVPTKVVTQPVRSGQQIYARGGDLLILAPVSAGAEVLADGHIHVYNSLRGRALAGVTGNEQARIFCDSLEAELLSIAGHYFMHEKLKGAFMKKMMLSLQEGKLKIDLL